MFHEIYNKKQYICSVGPDENPHEALAQMRREMKNNRLRLVLVQNGKRTEIDGPQENISTEEEDYDFEEYQDLLD